MYAHIFRYIILVIAVIATSSCNKDDEITAMLKPEITFDEPTGIYNVKVGHELTLSPVLEHAENAKIEWSMDGEVVCRQRKWTHRWDAEGEYYAMLTVTNAAGSVREEVRIDVVGAMPPAISLNVDSEGITMLNGSEYTFRPIYNNDGEDVEFSVVWRLNGNEVSRSRNYTFSADALGDYAIEVEATNIDGVTIRTINVTVVDQLPESLSFIPTGTRYTFASRSIYLRPMSKNIEVGATYEWSVNGKKTDSNEQIFRFCPESAGTYEIECKCGMATAMVEVVCVDATEDSRYRATSASSQAWSNKVYEWLPAPGQFIGDNSSVGGMSEPIVTMEQACQWAQQRMSAQKFVSLGAWGGYISVGFDHSIKSGNGEYDIAIKSNALDHSNEPGIVWVMQDVNGNGIPDDEWYELKGSDYASPSTIAHYAATYYRPGGNGMPVQWTDNHGASGIIDYLAGMHGQPSYYPQWVTAECYTLYGPRLQSRNEQNPVTGLWRNLPFDWGYVDNLGADLIPGGDTMSGAGQWVGFKIANAVNLDGSPANLDYIDFVKVQTGAMASSGALGELSTEVFGVADYSLYSKP